MLSPRAIGVLNRQLALREKLARAGKIDHDLLFFKASGKPLRNIQYTHTRWQRTLSRMRDIRYRKPYAARHTSVSWDLMVGRSALWVARQHGHSIATMLRFYAAWADGALESDVAAIRSAMNSERPPRRPPTPPDRQSIRRVSVVRPFEVEFLARDSGPPARFATGFATERCQRPPKCLNRSNRANRPETPARAPREINDLPLVRPILSAKSNAYGLGAISGAAC